MGAYIIAEAGVNHNGRLDLAKELTAYCGRLTVEVVPFTHIQTEIRDKCPEELSTVILRRFMLRAAERVARDEGCAALVTGESLGQVASQTIQAIACTDAVASLPVFRPLIGMDKLEIIADAQRLGTFEISSQDAPDCCTLFMPRSPETHAKIPVVEEAERAFPIQQWVEELVVAAEPHDYACPSYKPPKR